MGENKLRITQSAAYVSRKLSHLYDHSLYKKLGLRKPRTSISCRLYEQFAAYISRGLCNPWLIFPCINGPIVPCWRFADLLLPFEGHATCQDLPPQRALLSQLWSNRSKTNHIAWLYWTAWVNIVAQSRSYIYVLRHVSICNLKNGGDTHSIPVQLAW